jgi:hypothetical protein
MVAFLTSNILPIINSCIKFLIPAAVPWAAVVASQALYRIVILLSKTGQTFFIPGCKSKAIATKEKPPLKRGGF